MSRAGAGAKNSSLPSPDHIGRPPWSTTSYFDSGPVAGNGSTSVPPSVPIVFVTWYATQWPSGENVASVGMNDPFTSLNGVGFPSFNAQSEYCESFSTLNSSTSAMGEYDSGVGTVPGSGLNRGWTGPPSADCQNRARSPS